MVYQNFTLTMMIMLLNTSKDSKNIFINADDYGLTKNNTEEINYLIDKKFINSISVMINQYDFEVNKILDKNLKIKLHLNLTTSYTPMSEKNLNNLVNTSFVKLLFTFSKKNRQIYFDEIDYQINLFKKKFNLKIISLDSHHHVHMIPWIFKYIILRDDVYQIRDSIEKLNTLDIKDFKEVKVIRNLLALSVLYILKKLRIKSSYKNKLFPFYGLIYSGLYNQYFFSKQFNYINNNKFSCEIALHPSKIDSKEKFQFNKRDLKEIYSKNRKIEFNIHKFI